MGCAKILARSNPDLIGITTHTRVLQSAFELAKRSKEIYPEVPVVLGGHGAFMLEERIMRESKSVDIIVRGEGDESMQIDVLHSQRVHP